MSDGNAHEADRIRRYFGQPGRWSRWPAGRAYLVAERQRLLRRAVAQHVNRPVDRLAICDVGCGAGDDLAYWLRAGVSYDRLAGTELSAKRADAARQRVPGADIRVVDGFEVPFDTDRFDVATASLVLSTVRADHARHQLFAEMLRITAPGGIVVVYDFRVKRPGNADVVALSDRRIRGLGFHPLLSWSAAPFLPLLSAALRLPPSLQRAVVRLLPRTHALWLWQKAR